MCVTSEELPKHISTALHPLYLKLQAGTSDLIQVIFTLPTMAMLCFQITPAGKKTRPETHLVSFQVFWNGKRGF